MPIKRNSIKTSNELHIEESSYLESITWWRFEPVKSCMVYAPMCDLKLFKIYITKQPIMVEQ